MAESFLKEQLERFQRLAERMSQVKSQTQELSNLIAQQREAMAMARTPLHKVRDYRTYSADDATDTSSRSRSRRASTPDHAPRRRRR